VSWQNQSTNIHVNGSKLQLSMQRQRRKTFHPATFVCEHPGCKRHCKSARGLKQHHQSVHAIPPALLIHEAVPSPSPPASPVNDDIIMNMRTPSPTFSSHRSPRRFPNGSPLPNACRTSPLPINNGLTIITHPLLDGKYI
jgi:hypothetical protein